MGRQRGPFRDQTDDRSEPDATDTTGGQDTLLTGVPHFGDGLADLAIHGAWSRSTGLRGDPLPVASHPQGSDQ